MIDTIYLANYVESALNSNNLGLVFLIFADEGDLKKKVVKPRSTTEYTHGLLEVTSSSIVPIKNISFETYTTQLMVLVDLGTIIEKVGSKNREQSERLIDVKTVLNNFIKTYNGVTTQVTKDNVTYSMTLGLSAVTDGQKMSLGEIHDGLPLYMNIEFAFFQNGINTNDCHFYINHEDMYFTRAVITRVKTADNVNFAGVSGSKCYTLMGGKSLDLVIPTTNSTMGQAIMNDILNDNLNEAYCVRVATPVGNKNYICILGNDSVNMDAGANLGYNIALVEGNPSLLTYGNNWTISTETGSSVSKTTTGTKTIFWGDGKSDYVTTNGTTTHTYTDGKTSHIVRIYGGA